MDALQSIWSITTTLLTFQFCQWLIERCFSLENGGRILDLRLVTTPPTQWLIKASTFFKLSTRRLNADPIRYDVQYWLRIVNDQKRQGQLWVLIDSHKSSKEHYSFVPLSGKMFSQYRLNFRRIYLPPGCCLRKQIVLGSPFSRKACVDYFFDA